ncbi:hypothetical protein K469DRAFT_763015 [Zopfia rhizophila CBS 207.26]|uniref:BED-type domain-containing protein n=1 Tax=Zopfia rhizophila CBS 207.26 TaxID=1314779 RepID=A0A6A6DD36_9PEZI|nr:hypothetical protein K469DRAFT_763015 [Zopfia rhizophila CBS 207.26]
MERYLRSQTSQASSASSSYRPYHSAASKRLQKAAAALRSPSPSSSRDSTPLSRLAHEYPENDSQIVGVRFDIDWSHIYRRQSRLVPARVGYRVRHKSQLKGARKIASFWQYGVELQYLEDDGSYTRLWLCKACHLNRELDDCKAVDATHHIVNHLKKSTCSTLTLG